MYCCGRAQWFVYERFWCHFRLTYLSMSYLYGKRFVGPVTDMVLSLRKELHKHPYHEIDWNLAQQLCAKEDLYYPHPLAQDIFWEFLHRIAKPVLKQWPFSNLREKALKPIMEYIYYEDENSSYSVLELDKRLYVCFLIG